MRSGISDIKQSEEAIIQLLSLDEQTRQKLKPVIKSGVWTVIEVLEKVKELGECDAKTLSEKMQTNVNWTRELLTTLSQMSIGLTYKRQGGKVGSPTNIYYIDQQTSKSNSNYN